MYDALERTYMSKQGEFLSTAGRTWQKRTQLKGPTVASLRQTEHQKQTLWKYITTRITFYLFCLEVRGQAVGGGSRFHYISWGIELKWSGLLQVPLSSLGLYIVCVCVCFGGLFVCLL